MKIYTAKDMMTKFKATETMVRTYLLARKASGEVAVAAVGSDNHSQYYSQEVFDMFGRFVASKRAADEALAEARAAKAAAEAQALAEAKAAKAKAADEARAEAKAAKAKATDEAPAQPLNALAAWAQAQASEPAQPPAPTAPKAAQAAVAPNKPNKPKTIEISTGRTGARGRKSGVSVSGGESTYVLLQGILDSVYRLEQAFGTAPAKPAEQQQLTLGV